MREEISHIIYSGIKVMINKYLPEDTMMVDPKTYIRLKQAIENHQSVPPCCVECGESTEGQKQCYDCRNVTS